MSDITITCPSCHQELEVPQELLGQVAECPACEKTIHLPLSVPANVARQKVLVKRRQHSLSSITPQTAATPSQPKQQGTPQWQIAVGVTIIAAIIVSGIIFNGGIGWMLPGGVSVRTTVSEFAPTITNPSPSPVSTGPQLLLLSWSWRQEHGYAIIRGEVKNITSRNLDNIQVVASFYTDDDHFISTADAIVEFNPILPDQTSPFEAMATYNPRMRKAKIDFKELMGGTVEWRKQD